MQQPLQQRRADEIAQAEGGDKGPLLLNTSQIVNGSAPPDIGGSSGRTAPRPWARRRAATLRATGGMAPSGGVSTANRRRALSSPAWLAERRTSRTVARGPAPRKGGGDKEEASVASSASGRWRVLSCLRDCFRLRRFFGRKRGESELRSSQPPVGPRSPLSAESNGVPDESGDEFVESDAATASVGKERDDGPDGSADKFVGDDAATASVGKENERPPTFEYLPRQRSLSEANVSFASSAPSADSLVIGGRVVEGSKYRDEHRPCPFGGPGRTTPSPELLAGRPQWSQRRQGSMDSSAGSEPLAVRRAMTELRNARDHCCQTHFEVEYRRSFVVREIKHMKRRLTPMNPPFQPKPELGRSRGFLT